jgi:hypothetical protein
MTRKLPICAKLNGPVPILNEEGRASIDHALNYRERKEAAALIETLVEALESLLSVVESTERRNAKAVGIARAALERARQ